MKVRSLEYVMHTFPLPYDMEWLERRLVWHKTDDGKVLRPTLVKKGRYHVITFTPNELRGLAFARITDRITQAVEDFEEDIVKGRAKRLKVTKAEGIE